MKKFILTTALAALIVSAFISTLAGLVVLSIFITLLGFVLALVPGKIF